MNLIKLLVLFITAIFLQKSAYSQNALLNVLTQEAGIVKRGGIVFLEVTICNTSPTDSMPVYKLRPQISVPASIVTIPETGHTLPEGWTITFNSGSVIRLSNAVDRVPANTCRTLLIAMMGKTVGGPETVSGNLLFSNGISPGSVSGPPTAGDNPADNTSTSTCKVNN